MSQTAHTQTNAALNAARAAGEVAGNEFLALTLCQEEYVRSKVIFSGADRLERTVCAIEGDSM